MKKSFKKILINQNRNIRDGLILLQKTASQICLVIDDNSKLVGTITDGDLRRYFLKKFNFKTALKAVMNKNPITLPTGTSENKIITTLKRYKLSYIPIVNNESKVKNLVKLSDFVKPKKFPNQLVIMCGGLGTRLRPYTLNKPKCLLKVKNKTILEHIIDNATKQGFYKFIISINYLGKQIKDFVKNKKKFNDLEIKFIEEKKKLGTAGSLSLIKKEDIKKEFIVINGDVLTNLELNKILDFYHIEKTDAIMGVKIISQKSSYGIIKSISGNIIKLDEKPTTYSMVNAGIYLLKNNILKLMRFNKKEDMTDLFKRLIKKKKKIKAYPIYEKWHDIGSKEQFLSLKRK